MEYGLIICRQGITVMIHADIISLIFNHLSVSFLVAQVTKVFVYTRQLTKNPEIEKTYFFEVLSSPIRHNLRK